MKNKKREEYIFSVSRYSITEGVNDNLRTSYFLQMFVNIHHLQASPVGVCVNDVSGSNISSRHVSKYSLNSSLYIEKSVIWSSLRPDL